MAKKKKNMQKQEYNNESISALKGADRVRKRPAVIFGSDGLVGCQHTFFEILSNSIDEAREGFGEKILIKRHQDRSITIEDFARGIPVDYNKNEKRYNWELVFSELYAGGKYNTNEAESYEYSLGLNGLGLCATQYSSEYMDAEIYRDGYKYTLHFEKGENIGGLKKEKNKTHPTGTKITYKPDLEVFTENNIGLDYLSEVLKQQAIVNKGLLFHLTFETEEETKEFEFQYKEGIEGYVEEILEENDPIIDTLYWETETTGSDRKDKPEYRVKLSMAVNFSNRVFLTEYYHNSSFLEYGGSPEKAVRYAFVYQIDEWLKQNGKYKKDESKILYTDVQDCLVMVSSSFSTITSYENQTKKSITNRFIYESMSDFIKNQLNIYFLENPKEAERIAEQVLVNKRSRENAEKTRLNLRRKLSPTLDISNRIDSFIDCRTKDVSKREIFIVEGKSALGSCITGRNSEYQAVIALRGKILNCLKADLDRIFKNDIIMDLVKVLGCGVDVDLKSSKGIGGFDLNSLRWSKIVICTDADVDGFQIRTLILAMIYKLMPKLLEEGFVYIAESPLYEITHKNETYFAYTEQEKVRVIENLPDDRFKLQRSKGLGENDADMMWLTTMNPDTRRLVKVEPHDKIETAHMFDVLLGNNLEGRKEYITEVGPEYLELIDVS